MPDSLRLDAMLFLNAAGEPVVCRISKDYQERFKASEDFLKFLQQGLSHDYLLNRTGNKSGLMVEGENFVFLSSQPVFHSDSSGPPRGTVIFARFLDAKELKFLGDLLKAGLMVRRKDSPLLSQGFLEAHKAFLEGAEDFVFPFDSTQVAGYCLLKDLSQKNDLILKVLVPREITRFGDQLRYIFIFSLIAVGALFGILVYMPLEKEIRGRALAEKKLQELNNRFEQVVECSREIIWEVDQNGLYTYISASVKDSLGYDREELVGKKHFYDLHPEGGREDFKKVASEMALQLLDKGLLASPANQALAEIYRLYRNGKLDSSAVESMHIMFGVRSESVSV